MKSSDLSSSILIIIVFIVLYMFNFYVVGIQQVKDNWPLYRCNPLIMPFASVFGYDPQDNFSYCIKNTQTSFMSKFLDPLNQSIDALSSVGKDLTSNIADARSFLNISREEGASTHFKIFNTLFNAILQTQKLFINVKDMFGKLMGIVITFLNLLRGAIMTMESAWAGIPGDLVRALCFHPETKLELQNGEIISMKDIPLNSVLKNGTRVHAVMQITNIDEHENYIEQMYRVQRRDIKAVKDDILVSGSHLIYDPAIKEFVHVKDLSESNVSEVNISDVNCKTLTCLITSDHTIPIGGWIFHDWEDSNGSAPKTIGA